MKQSLLHQFCREHLLSKEYKERLDRLPKCDVVKVGEFLQEVESLYQLMLELYKDNADKNAAFTHAIIFKLPTTIRNRVIGQISRVTKLPEGEEMEARIAIDDGTDDSLVSIIKTWPVVKSTYCRALVHNPELHRMRRGHLQKTKWDVLGR